MKVKMFSTLKYCISPLGNTGTRDLWSIFLFTLDNIKMQLQIVFQTVCYRLMIYSYCNNHLQTLTVIVLWFVPNF